MEEVVRIIGKTHLVKLESISDAVGAAVYAKYEAANPGASIKDRAARSMIDRAEERGRIVPGKSVLIEPTSGNTGIALAMIGAVRGYRVILCMPESMSKERRAILTAYGAEIILTPAAEGMAGAVAKAQEVADTTPDSWIVGQFINPDNARAHEESTGPEIKEALGMAPDYLVAGVGTGGTISGVGHYLRYQGDRTKLYAVQPAESPIIAQALSGEEIIPAPHGIQGIGANFIPQVLDLELLEGALSVSTEEALQMARRIALEEGLLVGISSGANLAAVEKLVATHSEAKGKTIVTFLVDTGERYLSTALFEGLG